MVLLFILNALLLVGVLCVLFQAGPPQAGHWHGWLVYAIWAAFPIVNMIILLVLRLARKFRAPDMTAQVIDSFLEGSDRLPEPQEQRENQAD